MQYSLNTISKTCFYNRAQQPNQKKRKETDGSSATAAEKDEKKKKESRGEGEEEEEERKYKRGEIEKEKKRRKLTLHQRSGSFDSRGAASVLLFHFWYEIKSNYWFILKFLV